MFGKRTEIGCRGKNVAAIHVQIYMYVHAVPPDILSLVPRIILYMGINTCSLGWGTWRLAFYIRWAFYFYYAYIYIYQFLPKITQICIIKFDTYVIKDAVKILLELEKSKISTSNRFRYRVFFYFPPVDGVKMPETNA